MRPWIVSKIRGSPIENVAFELHERLHQVRGIWNGSFSQHGEDRLVLDYFGGRPGTYVDVGANYPIKISNTYLLYRHGWRGLTIEPIPRLSRRHRRLRPQDAHANAGIGEEGKELIFYELDDSVASTFDEARMRYLIAHGSRVKREHRIRLVPLSQLIQDHLGDVPIQMLTVDTEGFDFQVLRSLDWQKTKPQLVIYEEDKSGSADIQHYLESKGYRTYRVLHCNRIMELVEHATLPATAPRAERSAATD